MAKIRMQMQHIIVVSRQVVANITAVHDNHKIINVDFGGIPAVIHNCRKIVMRDPASGRFMSLPCEV